MEVADICIDLNDSSNTSSASETESEEYKTKVIVTDIFSKEIEADAKPVSSLCIQQIETQPITEDGATVYVQSYPPTLPEYIQTDNTAEFCEAFTSQNPGSMQDCGSEQPEVEQNYTSVFTDAMQVYASEVVTQAPECQIQQPQTFIPYQDTQQILLLSPVRYPIYQFNPNYTIQQPSPVLPAQEAPTHPPFISNQPEVQPSPKFQQAAFNPEANNGETMKCQNIECPPKMELKQAQKFPVVYVSPAGLLTVLLKHDVAVEMTTDKTIRVVNHRHSAVAATNGRGNSSCIYHSAAKIFQQGTTTEVDVYYDRRAYLSTDNITFSSGPHCYTQQNGALHLTQPSFSDLSKDITVNLLFSSSGYGPNLIPQCEELVKKAKYSYLPNGAIIARINGIKIFQDATGEVSVISGLKVLNVSPVYGSMHIKTHFVEMAVEMNWNIKVQRGGHFFNASFVGMVISTKEFKCGFDQYRKPFMRHLEPQERIRFRTLQQYTSQNHQKTRYVNHKATFSRDAQRSVCSSNSSVSSNTEGSKQSDTSL